MENKSDNLGLIIMSNCKELGQKVNRHLRKIRNNDQGYIIPIKETRFSNGEGKIKIEESVRGKEIYVLADVGCYGITYPFHGRDQVITPDEHFADLKRVNSATQNHAEDIYNITPLLMSSRQHRGKSRESKDCTMYLRELENQGVKGIITIDPHDPNVSNMVEKLSFNYFYPTNIILEQILEDDYEFFTNCLIISPDMGAMERARYYSEIIRKNIGVFYKVRDPLTDEIIEHKYIGENVKGKNILVVDDMIDSGGSMLDVVEELSKSGANKVYITSTFSLFSKGIKKFEEAYEKNLFTKLYTTNSSYIPKEIQNKEWIGIADISMFLAEIIDKLNKKQSAGKYYDNKKEMAEKMQKIIEEKSKN